MSNGKMTNNNIEDVFSLTPLQEGMLFHNILENESSEYIMQFAYRFKMIFNREKLCKALDLLALRYNSIRTSFFYEKIEKPRQIVLRDRRVELIEKDWSDQEDNRLNDLLTLYLDEDLKRGFDLKKDSLMRVTYIRQKTDSILVFSMHHIIVDGWSISLLFQSFWKYYNSLSLGIEYDEILNEIRLSKKAGDYSLYVKWLEKQDRETAFSYWNKLLMDYDGSMELLAPNKTKKKKKAIAKIKKQITKDQYSKIISLANEVGCTINTIMETIVGIMLQVYNRTNDVVFGKVVSGRNANVPGIENMVGLFINTIPIRVRSEENMTIRELLVDQQEQGNNSVDFGYCSLAEIQKLSDLGSELIKVLFIFENFSSGMTHGDEESDASAISLLKSRDETNYDMNIACYENEEGICFEITFDQEQYDYKNIEYLAERLGIICDSVVLKPDGKVTEIEIINDKERKIISGFNATYKEYNKEKTIVKLFEEQVRRNPYRIAVNYEGRTLTYSELNAKANSLAFRLHEIGVQADDYVVILAERSLEMFVAIYGILKSGGAYVPVDPDYPEERIQFVLDDCEPKAIVTYGCTLRDDIIKDIPLIDLTSDDILKEVKENPESISNVNNLAYCIYTSGTTGRPKGIEIKHLGVINLICNFISEKMSNEIMNVALVAAYVFDASVQNIFGPLITGKTLFIVPDECKVEGKKLLDFFETNKIQMADCTPTHLKLMLQDEVTNIESLSCLLVGGEALETQLAKEILAKGYCKEIINVYGPTECSVDATFYEINSETEKVCIGKPIANTQVYMMENNRLCGIGVPGELCIAGDGLARGYLNRSDLTAEKFVKNPFGEERMYHTGDLARWLPNGNIEYLGRIDDQVKIRGYRIELGEIESRIREIDGIKDCAVIAREGENDEKAIYAYVVGDGKIAISELRDEMGRVLPTYMMPEYMMQIDTIPITANGKLNRHALPIIKDRIVTEYMAPQNEEEQIVCDCFCDVLKIDKVSVTDNFFTLGGHSLRATRLVNKIEEKTGHRLPLKQIFSNPTPKKIAELIFGGSVEQYKSIPKAGKKEYYQMSSAQKRVFLVCEMEPESLAYNMPLAVKLRGNVNPEKLKNALKDIIKRHEIYRTHFEIVDEEFVQYISDSVEEDFEYFENYEKSDEELLSAFVRPFDLRKSPLIRMLLVQRRDYYLMCVDMHHIVSDGMSTTMFYNELSELYNGKELPLPTHQFKDYSEWMRVRDLTEQAKYWKEQFDDEIPVLEIPTDFARTAEQNFKGAVENRIFDRALTEKIKEIEKRTGTTDFMVFMSVLMILMSKYSCQEDVIIGTSISGRTHKDTEKILGMFVNTLALRGKPSGEKEYLSFLKEIKEICLRAYENQEYPFEELIDAINIQHDASRNPLFDVMMVLQNNEKTNAAFNDIKLEECDFELKGAKFDLLFNVVEYEGNWMISVEYRKALYKREYIKRMLEHFEVVLSEAMKDPLQLINKIETTDDLEKEMILKEFNATYETYPKDKTIAELFEERVKMTPDDTALVFEKKRLTYYELNERANRIALKLRQMGIRPNDTVAILAGRSLEMVIAVYGILKAGAGYVPIDATYPAERIRFILEDSDPKVILTYNVVFEEDITNGFSVVDLTDSDTWEKPSDNLPVICNPDDLAYIIYTSGTTGKPKGILIKQSNVINYVAVADRSIMKYPFENGFKKIISAANISFDIFVTETILAHYYGMTVFVANEEERSELSEFEKLICENGIEIFQSTPSRIKSFWAQDPETKVFSRLKYMMLGGEIVGKELVGRLKENSDVVVENVYGPSETTVWGTCYEINELSDNIPVGKAIGNVKTYVVQKGVLCGIGIPGELCIAGDGVARGYLNRPDLNSEKFVPNLYGTGKMYHTGDLVRWLQDGNLEYLGRIDDQVKIRGFRIELGEVESTLRSIEYVKDCAVVVRKDSSGENAIFAYIVSDDKVKIPVVREILGKELPYYMIPAYMVQIDKIPINKNGKLDRRALQDIEIDSGREYMPPENEKEILICQIFEEVLGREKVGVMDSFYELGGDSIKAIHVVSKIRKKGYTVTIKDVMRMRTPRSISLCIKRELGDGFEERNIESRMDDQNDKYSLTPMQSVMYFHNEAQLADNSYHMQFCFKANMRIDMNYLRKATFYLADKYEVLKSSFVEVKDKGEVKQYIDHTKELCVEKREYSDNFSELLLKEYAKEDFEKGFDLEKDALFRIIVLSFADVDMLFIGMHHIIYDGWCNGLIFGDLKRFYDAFLMKKDESEIKELVQTEKKEVMPLRNYVEYLEGIDMKDTLKFWEDYLEGYDSVAELTPIEQVEKKSIDSVAEGKRVYSNTFTGKLMGLAKENETTISTVVQLAVALLLQRHCDIDDVLIGKVVSGRNIPLHGIENAVGLFANAIPLRVTTKNKEARICDMLHELHDANLSCTNYDHLSLATINLGREKVARYIKHMFVFQNYPVQIGTFEENGLEFESVYTKQEIDYDITFLFFMQGEELVVEFLYRPERFTENNIRILQDHLQRILGQMVEDSRIRIKDLVLYDEIEKRMLLEQFNDSFVELPKEKVIINYFDEQVKKTPNAIAVVFEGQELTYDQLSTKVDLLAAKLRNAGVVPDDFVAIIAERGFEMIIALLGVLKSGGAYIPVDPSYPADRISYMLEDSKPKVVLTFGVDSNLEMLQKYHVIDLSDETVWHGESKSLEVVGNSENLAYCIYTSGTTGMPKGVMIKQCNVVNYIVQSPKSTMAYAFENNLKRFVSVTNFVFDIFVTEVILTLCNGMTMYLADKQEQTVLSHFKKLVKENDIEILQTTPSRIKGMLSQDSNTDVFSNMKYIMLGGEAVNEDIVQRLSKSSKAVIENVYGPSETTVWSTCMRVDQKKGSIPIGKPIANTQVYILQDDILCGIGAQGELCIAGEGLARGYLNQKELTEKKFVNNPYGNGKLYRTGDLARWLPDGNIEFLGRIDDQVKIRGFRIELGEIESKIREIEEVKDCAVVAKDDINGEKAIYAYIVEDKTVDAFEIREKLSENLPYYMLPAYIIQIERIPITKNGKLDRKALPEPSVKTEKDYVAPMNELEELICRLAEEVLELERVGVDDDFLELGIHSVSFVQLQTALENEGYVVDIPELFQNTTPRQLARVLNRSEIR